MLTLMQVQSIFNCAFYSFNECAKKGRVKSVEDAANKAAAASLKFSPLDMAKQVEDVVYNAATTALMMLNYFDPHGNFNTQFAENLKINLETLFKVTGIIVPDTAYPKAASRSTTPIAPVSAFTLSFLLPQPPKSSAVKNSAIDANKPPIR